MSRRRSVGLAAGALGGAAAVVAIWFALLGHPGIWTDEEYTLRYTESFSTVDDDVHPPTYYAVLRSWFLLVPDTLVSARMLSALAFVGAVAMWLLLARRWGREGRVAAPAMVVMSVLSLASPHAVLFGRMARYFGLVGFTTALALWCWWSMLARPTHARAAAAVAAHVSVGLLSYPAFVVLVAAESLTVVLRRWSDLRRHLPMVAAATAIWLLAVVVLPTNEGKFGGSEDVNRVTMAAASTTLPLWSATIGETVSPVDPVPTVPLVAAWAVLGFATVAALRARSAEAVGSEPSLRVRWLPADPAVLLCLLLVVGTLVSLVLASLTVDLAHTGLQSPKYFAPISPALYLLAGLGFERLRTHARQGVAWLVAAGVAMGWSIGLFHLYRSEDYLYPSYALPWDDVADAAAAIAGDHAQDGRSVIVVSSDRAVLRLLAERRPPADLFDANAVADDALVYDGSTADHYDVVVLVQRQRLNAPAEEAVEQIRTASERQGFRQVSTQSFGSVDPGLRRLQELASGRDLDGHLVEVDVLVDR